MKVHICARRESLERAGRVAEELKAAGHEVVSRWLTATGKYATIVENASYALHDLLASECVVVLAEGQVESRSLPGAADRMVELGYALKAGKRTCVLGPRETSFAQLPNVEQYRTTRELVRAL
jgi:Zn-dependent membrane protease YugP